jgi:hypothetical protein
MVATLGVSHPSLTGRASSGADAVHEGLGGVRADTLTGVSRVFLLTSRAADGFVTGPTASAAHFVAQDLSTGAGSGTVTLSVGGTRAGKSAALRKEDQKRGEQRCARVEDETGQGRLTTPPKLLVPRGQQ